MEHLKNVANSTRFEVIVRSALLRLEVFRIRGLRAGSACGQNTDKIVNLVSWQANRVDFFERLVYMHKGTRANLYLIAAEL